MHENRHGHDPCEIITKASVNYETVIREAVKATGYDSDDKGLDWRTVNVIVAVDEQSPDLAQAITINKVAEEVGAGDHGVVFGYATDETPERMPLSHLLQRAFAASWTRRARMALSLGHAQMEGHRWCWSTGRLLMALLHQFE